MKTKITNLTYTGAEPFQPAGGNCSYFISQQDFMHQHMIRAIYCQKLLSHISNWVIPPSDAGHQPGGQYSLPLYGDSCWHQDKERKLKLIVCYYIILIPAEASSDKWEIPSYCQCDLAYIASPNS